jgi:superfamily II RNA helicase
MVKICQNQYPNQNEEKYEAHFTNYSFPLSSFQKYAIEAIVEGDHILVTAHTGSGKTLPGEFAIEYFVGQGKKVIYTAPIKALSNQKFYEFTQKYPHISFGILTGDIKFNPEADVLIMTTEILQNTLYRRDSTQIKETPTPSNLLMFDMDIEKELACVIFDEVHYINDAERGKVWEETIMMLPYHVQMVMLSATLDQPEKFALWCENRDEKKEKKVYLTTTYERVVPLIHYTFLTSTNAIFKVIKDKAVQEEIKKATNKPFVLQDEKGVFNESNYMQMKKTMDLFNKKEVRIKRSFALNQVLKYLVEKEMLPALCFVLSRKLLETYAKEITTNLLEFDSKVPYIVRRECEQIIRKLPNYQEYLQLPEYQSMVSLLEKGIAIHHAGVMPILREMVELLYAKGFVKIVFCTETFAVGINMPTKTVLFTDVTKFDGKSERVLYSHEYTQMAGRAGRRGMDTIGHVIHLNNIFRPIDSISYKNMMKGKPQTLVSKFKVSYPLLLNLLDTGHTDLLNFVRKSMITNKIDDQLNELVSKKTVLETELHHLNSTLKNLRTPLPILNEFIELNKNREKSVNKKRKEIDRVIEKIKDHYNFILTEQPTVIKYNEKGSELEKILNQIKYIENDTTENIQVILDLLENQGFVSRNEVEEEKSNYSLTIQGKIATHLHEIHCLTLARLLSIQNGGLRNLEPKQLVAIFSCFTNITVSEDLRSIQPLTEDEKVKTILLEINKMYQDYQNIECENILDTGTNYDCHYDLLGYVEKWCDCENIEDCKILLQTMAKEKEIFLGEFVKALLKINNISAEMEKVAELVGDIDFLSHLRQIPFLTLKYVVTNQSLYL